MNDVDKPIPSALRELLRRVGVYAGLLIAGAVFAFGYSYVPLHNAKNWQIDHLESRLEATNQELIRLRELVDNLEADTADRPDADTLKTVQKELDRSDEQIAELEKSLERAQQQAKALQRERDEWQRKHRELAAQLDATSRTRVATNPPAEPPPITTRAPAPTTTPATAPATRNAGGTADAGPPVMTPAPVSAPEDL